MRLEIKKLMSEDAIPGGKSDGMTLSDIAILHGVEESKLQAELDKGIKVEKEHTTSDAIAREIALDHLAEDPKYYTKLASVHKESVKRTSRILTEHDWTVVIPTKSGETEIDLDNFLDLYEILGKNKEVEVYDDSSNFSCTLTILKRNVDGAEHLVKWQIHTPKQSNGSGKLHLFISKYIVQQVHKKIIEESAPPSKKIEKWILDNKKEFIDKYGQEKGTELVYATAWKMYDGVQPTKNEEVAANNVGSGAISGTNAATAFKPTSWFANCGVFSVDPSTYYRLQHGKKHKARYTTILDKADPLYEKIRGFAYQNGGKGIILQNSVSGSMVYLKHPAKRKT